LTGQRSNYFFLAFLQISGGHGHSVDRRPKISGDKFM